MNQSAQSKQPKQSKQSKQTKQSRQFKGRVLAGGTFIGEAIVSHSGVNSLATFQGTSQARLCAFPSPSAPPRAGLSSRRSVR
ncbi:MAG: hypothetical protein ACTTJZ_05855 [Sphaerochaetaceae bacterium]